MAQGRLLDADTRRRRKAALVVVYDPNTGTGSFTNPIGNTPVANNVIPGNGWISGGGLMSYLPNPNRPPTIAPIRPATGRETW